MTSGLPPLDHVVVLSDDTGIIQHATYSVPNRSTGYCTDDVARAFIVALMHHALHRDELSLRLASTYLSFLHDAQLDDGRFHNFMSYDRAWLDEVGTHDSVGRAIWSLGYGMRFAPSQPWRTICAHMFDRALSALDWLEFPRAEAYALLGLRHAFAADPRPLYRAAIERLATSSLGRLHDAAGEMWFWFEDIMTYDNARLPEALMLAGRALRSDDMVRAGLQTLDFLETVVFENGVFVPIGNDEWYRRGGVRARFAQQPLEAVAMVDAELAAFSLDERPERLAAARRAHEWYRGANSVGVPLALEGGGCYDGLDAQGANANMGAESTLAYLASAYALALRQKQPSAAP
ncbi:MAG: glycosyltransferase [Candidatus Eremiobacteraeota bacterium]|nr:glycosyltransferase [Candidatus Eremiobacteraeota bacterium]